MAFADIRATVSAGGRATAGAIAVLDGKPLGVAFALDVTGVSIVDQVPQLVDEDVVQVVVAGRLLAPGKRPGAGRRLGPAATVHASFVHQIWPRRHVELLGER